MKMPILSDSSALKAEVFSAQTFIEKVFSNPNKDIFKVLELIKALGSGDEGVEWYEIRDLIDPSDSTGNKRYKEAVVSLYKLSKEFQPYLRQFRLYIQADKDQGCNPKRFFAGPLLKLVDFDKARSI